MFYCLILRKYLEHLRKENTKVIKLSFGDSQYLYVYVCYYIFNYDKHSFLTM